MSPLEEDYLLDIADRLHSAAIHLLRYARKDDELSRQAPARLSALSVLIFVGPMTLGKLAAAEQVKPPTMSRIVDGLKRSGLARVEADEKDGRRLRIRATPKGERLLQDARERRIKLLADAIRHGDEVDIALLSEAAKLIELALKGKLKKQPRFQ
jgi:DNA-binding MarR family transcriptional regulator